jgi:toxin ParE1/3/4
VRIRFRRSAQASVKWFRHYYSGVFQAGEANAGRHFEVALLTLEAHLRAGKVVDEDRQIRELQIARTPFAIIYVIENEDVVILRLKDGRARPDKPHS